MEKNGKDKKVVKGAKKEKAWVSPLAYNLTETAMRLSLSRPTVSRLIAENRLRHRRVGRRVLVSHDALIEFLDGYDLERGEK